MTPHDRDQFIKDIAAVLTATKQDAVLSDDEHQWVKLAIQREAQSIKLRQSVIDKTLTALLWSCVIGLGIVFREYLNNHGFKL
jgi:hypothetical protein